MSKVYVFLADGFEEVEGLTSVDLLRRAGADLQTVSIMGRKEIHGAHGINLEADLVLEDGLEAADLMILPGGMPGTNNLKDHEGLADILKDQYKAGRMVAAICAAPLVLGGLGLLRGHRATCYPGFEQTLLGAEYTAELFTIDGNITTGEGPAAALPYAYSLLEQLVDSETSHAVAEGMRFLHLMGK